MTTYIYLDNYRGFNNSFIPVQQVNFLVGENSTGKTSFLEIFEMFCTPAFWMTEPNFSMPEAQARHFLDLVSASSTSKKQFTVGAMDLSTSGSDTPVGMLVTYVNSEGRPVPRRISIIEKDYVKTIDGRLWIEKKKETYKVRSSKLRGPLSEQSIVKTHKSSTGFHSREVEEEITRLPLLMIRWPYLFSNKTEVSFNSELNLNHVPAVFRTSVADLAPIRSKPRRTYDAPQTEYSSEGEHTPYVIKKRLSSKTQADEFEKFLKRVGKDSSLFESIGIKTYGKSQLAPFEIKVVLGKSALGLDSVGYGVSQSLPVIVEMFVRPKRSTFMVQQPEVHLHPKAQASIGDLVAEFARIEAKRFVVETHSDFTIDRFRLNIRKGGAIPSQLLFFERSNIGNLVTPIKIDENGNLDVNQPDGYRAFFFNESLALLS